MESTTISQIVTLQGNLTKELEAFSKGNKTAGKRARKITLELDKLHKVFRKESVQA